MEELQFLINSRQNSFTGYSPLDVLLGRKTGTCSPEPISYFSWIRNVHQMDEEVNRRQQLCDTRNRIYFDKNRRNINFRINEVVLCKDLSSLRTQSVKFGNPWRKAREFWIKLISMFTWYFWRMENN